MGGGKNGTDRGSGGQPGRKKGADRLSGKVQDAEA